MVQRHRRGEIERLLRKRERRGLTYRELSEESGIPAGTLGWWARRLHLEGALAMREGELVEVEVVEDGDATQDPAIEIVVGAGVRLRVPASASEAHLRRVLRAVASC